MRHRDRTGMMRFGKYSGQSISTVRRDRPYCRWLCSQVWFAERFPALHRRLAAEPVSGTVVPWEVIRSRFAAVTDTLLTAQENLKNFADTSRPPSAIRYRTRFKGTSVDSHR